MAHASTHKNMAKQMTGVTWHVHLLISHDSSSKQMLNVSHAHSTLIFEEKTARLHRFLASSSSRLTPFGSGAGSSAPYQA